MLAHKIKMVEQLIKLKFDRLSTLQVAHHGVVNSETLDVAECMYLLHLHHVNLDPNILEV
jgi:hypothetical protein